MTTKVITKSDNYANKKTERFGCLSVNVNKNLTRLGRNGVDDRIRTCTPSTKPAAASSGPPICVYLFRHINTANIHLKNETAKLSIIPHLYPNPVGSGHE